MIDDLVWPDQLAAGKLEMPRYDGVRARLDANESPYPLDRDVAAELGAVLARVDLNRYPDSEASELRRIAAADFGVPPDRLVIGNGSQDLLVLIVAAFARPRPGSDGRARILYPEPTFVGYPLAARMLDAVPVAVPLRADFALDPPALDAAFEAARPNVAFFALPNNPTGTLWPRSEVLRLAERHRDTVIVADEAYAEYSGESVLDALPAHPNVVVLRTLSKLGLAGLRVGFLIGAPAVIRHVEKLRPPYNVGALNQAAAAWLLATHPARLRARVAAVTGERDRLARELAALPGMQVFPSRASYLLVRHHRATALCEMLTMRGVLVRNFDGPRAGLLAGCFRVTAGTPDENSRFLAALRDVLPALE